MKVGDYVRTKYGIRKITNLETYCNLIVETDKGDLDIDKILKSSPNIIDLIEVGDYVNGERVIALEKDVDKRNIYPSNIGVKIFTDYEIQGNWYFGIQEEDIKSIVTKEQFESMEYKIEE